MAQFEIRDLTPPFGSEVVGFDPAELDAAEVRNLLHPPFEELLERLLRAVDVRLGDVAALAVGPDAVSDPRADHLTLAAAVARTVEVVQGLLRRPLPR